MRIHVKTQAKPIYLMAALMFAEPEERRKIKGKIKRTIKEMRENDARKGKEREREKTNPVNEGHQPIKITGCRHTHPVI